MSITGIGVMGPGGFTSMDYYVMQSRQNLEKVIPDFEEAIKKGYNPNDVKDKIFELNGVDEDSFTRADAAELTRRVEKIYKTYRR